MAIRKPSDKFFERTGSWTAEHQMWLGEAQNTRKHAKNLYNKTTGNLSEDARVALTRTFLRFTKRGSHEMDHEYLCKWMRKGNPKMEKSHLESSALQILMIYGKKQLLNLQQFLEMSNELVPEVLIGELGNFGFSFKVETAE